MRKLKLEVETLRVESFDTAAAEERRGTVRGAEGTFDAECQTWENPWCGYQTVEVQSCGGGCTGTGGGHTAPTGCHTCFYASCDGYTC